MALYSNLLLAIKLIRSVIHRLQNDFVHYKINITGNLEKTFFLKYFKLNRNNKNIVISELLFFVNIQNNFESLRHRTNILVCSEIL